MLSADMGSREPRHSTHRNAADAAGLTVAAFAVLF